MVDDARNPVDATGDRRSAPATGRKESGKVDRRMGNVESGYATRQGEGQTEGERARMQSEWQVMATGTTAIVMEIWGRMVPQWQWATIKEDGWPHCMVGTGNDIAEAIGNSARTPEWVIVDGGELHRTSVEVMKARHLKKWGIRGSLSV